MTEKKITLDILGYIRLSKNTLNITLHLLNVCDTTRVINCICNTKESASKVQSKINNFDHINIKQGYPQFHDLSRFATLFTTGVSLVDPSPFKMIFVSFEVHSMLV